VDGASVRGDPVERHPDADLLVAGHRQERQVLVPRRALRGAGLLAEDLVVEEDDLFSVREHLAGHVDKRTVDRPRLERVIEHPGERQREEPRVAVVCIVLRRRVGLLDQPRDRRPHVLDPVVGDDALHDGGAVAGVGGTLVIGHRADQTRGRVVDADVQDGGVHGLSPNKSRHLRPCNQRQPARPMCDREKPGG